MLSVQEVIATGEHESVAVQRAEPPVHRSTYRHWVQRHSQYGFEGLIDCRLPEPGERIPQDVQAVVCALRRAEPDIGVASIVSHVRNHHKRRVSESSVKRILKRTGLHRARGQPRRQRPMRGKSLCLGGVKLIEAAAVSTGYLDALTKTVVDHVASLPVPEGAKPPDCGDRDARGRFLGSYNERYRKCEGDAVGPGFASVALKREEKDPSLFHVHGAGSQVVERKLWALMCSPLIGSGDWDGMRTPRGKLLEELCGYAYMPATLSLFTSELKYAGVSPALWESHASTWHAQTQEWGSPRHAAVLYVDGTSKPIFTDLNSQCTHISLLHRTMPGLDIVGFHSGYGVPLWYLAHSGRAPLVKAVPEAIQSLERQVGANIGRIVVIDAEGNSAPFLSGLEHNGRSWVTRLRPAMVKDKLVANWTSFRPYRDNDRIREGELDLLLGKDDVLRVRLLEIERRASGQVVHLAASKQLRIQDWKTDEVADLYFARWPNQELDFRAVNQATGFKRVRGYGKRLVDNVAVTTKLEEVQQRQRRAEERATQQRAKLEDLEVQRELYAAHRKAAQEQKEGIDDAVDTHLECTTIDADGLRNLNQDRKAAERAFNKAQQREQRTQARLNNAQALLQRTTDRVEHYNEQKLDLATKTKILAHDVELDSLFNVLKVGFTLLVTYVLRTMLDGARITPATFLDRIATLPARQRLTDKYEYVTFEYNPRDPTMMALLVANCPTINALQLPMRSGLILQVAVEDPPQRKDKDDSS